VERSCIGTRLAEDSIDWADHARRTALEHVRVDHRGSDVSMAEEGLHRANVVAVLQEVRREGVTQRVTRDSFRDARASRGSPDGALNYRFVQVMSPGLSGLAISVRPGRREDPLPSPVWARSGILASDRERQFHPTRTLCSIPAV
jgi:hypothetical protein